LVNDAPTTVAAKMPQASTILPTMVAASYHDGCCQKRRSVQRWMPHGSTMFAAAMPQPPTTAAAGNAAGFHDVCRRNAAAASHRKTAPKTHPEKTGI
jgi:hypothetical protein